jgi:hypothetical protein
MRGNAVTLAEADASVSLLVALLPPVNMELLSVLFVAWYPCLLGPRLDVGGPAGIAIAVVI